MRIRSALTWPATTGAAALALATVLAAPAPAHAAPPTMGAATPPTYSWPQFAHDPRLTGVSGDPSISVSNASTLGVSWMANTGAIALGSPVVAWNAEDQKTLIYTSNESGYFTAYDQATHEPSWSINFGGGMRSTPLVEGAFVWVAPTSAHRIYKLDAGTGAVQCSAPLPYNTDASATVATPPGGTATVYIGVNDTGPHNGPLVAVAEASCAVDFSVTPEPLAGTGGIWDGASYAVDATGEGLVLFGTADPDSAVYAVDAITGALVWRYATQNPPPGIYDIGAGVTISPPGVNGFAGGVAYAVNKAGYVDALDLTTGALLWTVQRQPTISTPSLAGPDLVYGDGTGVTSLDAATGALLWHTDTGASIDGSLDIVGSAGSQVAAYGDLNGTVHALSLATGTPLFSYQTGGFIVSAVAEDDHNLIVTSGDGFLYDFTPGGGTAAAPVTAVTSPADSSAVPNPNGPLTVSGGAGTAGGPAVAAVQVSVQQGGASGTWWDSATQTWTAAPYGNPATLATPGTSTSTWTLKLPVPAAGGSYEVFASAVGVDGVADVSADQSPPTSSRVSFSVTPSSTVPTLALSSGWGAPASSMTVSGGGFQPGETIHVSLAGTALATATASATGGLASTGFRVPTGMPFGPASVTAVGASSGRATSAPLYLTNSWGQFRANPLRSGADPNDSVLANHLSVSASTFLTQGWSFNSGAPISTSPAVVRAVAYFANGGGKVFAVSVRTGLAVWTHQEADAKAITSSPAVDPATDGGIVLFGTAAGSVVALRMSDGTARWRSSVGTSAVESSPAVAGGVVYVGSDSGAVYAIDETSGALLWQTTLTGAVHSSPAVDTVAGLLLVGDDSGRVTALSTLTGAVQWVAMTGGPVVASPLLAGGAVYVGSQDGTMYSLTETSGARRWATAFTGPITSSAALYGSTLLVGDQSGHLAYLNPATGAVTFSKVFGGAVVGTSITQGFSVAETANGLVSGSKGPGQGGWTTRLTGALNTAPTIINGEVFVDGQDGMLHCYTIPGLPAV